MSGYKILMVAALVAAITPHALRRDLWPILALGLASVPFLAIPGLSDRAYTPIPANHPFIGGALMLAAGWLLCHWCRDFWQIVAAGILAVGVVWSALRMWPGALGEGAHAIGLEVLFYAIMLTGGVSAFVDIEDLPPPMARTADSIMQAVARWNGSAQ